VSANPTRGASNVRREYMKAMVAQDVSFFDDAQAGELSAVGLALPGGVGLVSWNRTVCHLK
jgi:hypothetical protein